MLKEKKNRKKNQGFSLITVIVAVSFVGILGLLVLYMSLSNFYMKTTDIKGKDSFYTAERALEEIRTGLQQDVGDALSEAYIEVLEGYDQGIEPGMEDVSEEELRQEQFQKLFIEELSSRLQTSGDPAKYNLGYLKTYLDLTKDTGKFNPDAETLLVTTPAGCEPLMKKGNKSGILLKNLKIVYVDPMGRASVIQTDIRLGMPKVKFPTATTLPDLMSLSVVADSGIICESDKTARASTISGSVYAGRLTEDSRGEIKDIRLKEKYSNASVYVKEGAGLNITSGDKFVSEGEILVGQNGAFSSASGIDLWAQGIALASAEVTLQGTTYLSDDLTVESGNSSKVTISGSYYGYGAADSARTSLNNNNIYNGLPDAALSSAIVINGKNTTMDLSGLDRLMLSGRNYISTSVIKQDMMVNGAIQETNKNSDILMGESITVKGTQLAYLLPPQLLGEQTEADEITAGVVNDTPTDPSLTNPMTYTTYLEYLAKIRQEDMPVKSEKAVAAWGGKTLRQIGVDEYKPIQTVFYNDNAVSGGGYVYFYLNFTDEKNAARFMSEYYYPTSGDRMNDYLSFYFGKNSEGEDSGIMVEDSSTYLRYITNGNVLTYDGAEKEGKIQRAQAGYSTQNDKAEQENLQNTWYALNRKMLTSVNFLNKEVKDEDGIIHDERDSSRSVFDNLINEKALLKAVENVPGKRLDFKAEGLRAIVYHNAESGSYQNADKAEMTVLGKNELLKIGGEDASSLRLVICTGDVEIDGVEFQGIILTKGKITLSNGASLKSSSQEAAKVFRAVNGDLSPKDFFWDGADYAPGSSQSQDPEGGNAETDTVYDLADFVTYENWKKQ